MFRFFLALILFPAVALAQEAPDPGLFPAPISHQTITLRAATEADPGLQVECHGYPGLTVKELRDLSDEGDSQISFIPGNPAPCAAAPARGEIPLSGDDSSNYLWGAVENFVFLVSPDSDGYGGLQLTLFAAPAPKSITSILFMATQATPPVLRHGPGWLRFTYDSEASAPCAVATAGRACLEALEQASGATISMEDCLRTLQASDMVLAQGVCGGSNQCVAKDMKEYPSDPETGIEFRQTLVVQGKAVRLSAGGQALACLASD